MNDTTDKIADKLLASIQKSQQSPTENTPPKKPATSNAKRTIQKNSKETTASELKATTDEANLDPFASPRRFKGNLRWPD